MIKYYNYKVNIIGDIYNEVASSFPGDTIGPNEFCSKEDNDENIHNKILKILYAIRNYDILDSDDETINTFLNYCETNNINIQKIKEIQYSGNQIADNTGKDKIGDKLFSWPYSDGIANKVSSIYGISVEDYRKLRRARKLEKQIKMSFNITYQVYTGKTICHFTFLNEDNSIISFDSSKYDKERVYHDDYDIFEENDNWRVKKIKKEIMNYGKNSKK